MKLSQSISKKKIGIYLSLVSALATSTGQIAWKIANSNINLILILGFALYILGAISMISAFRFGKLSVLHPLLSLGYVFGLLLSNIFLDEIITYKGIVAIIVITVGAILIGGDDDH
jgi:drug/metabolite transporter (DMT)-like permease